MHLAGPRRGRSFAAVAFVVVVLAAAAVGVVALVIGFLSCSVQPGR